MHGGYPSLYTCCLQSIRWCSCSFLSIQRKESAKSIVGAKSWHECCEGTKILTKCDGSWLFLLHAWSNRKEIPVCDWGCPLLMYSFFVLARGIHGMRKREEDAMNYGKGNWLLITLLARFFRVNRQFLLHLFLYQRLCEKREVQITDQSWSNIQAGRKTGLHHWCTFSLRPLTDDMIDAKRFIVERDHSKLGWVVTLGVEFIVPKDAMAL
jgi:hypothetical protein